MKLITIESQFRRDFIGLYQCENCLHTMKTSGYDDRNFHDNVAPRIICPKCHESTISSGHPVKYTNTKYPRCLGDKNEKI